MRILAPGRYVDAGCSGALRRCAAGRIARRAGSGIVPAGGERLASSALPPAIVEFPRAASGLGKLTQAEAADPIAGHARAVEFDRRMIELDDTMAGLSG